MSELTETKAKIYEALTKRKDGQIDWLFKEIDSLKSQLAERDRDLELAVKALERIAKNTYGTELCNSDQENNEILARHFFSHQNIAREALANLGGNVADKNE